MFKNCHIGQEENKYKWIKNLTINLSFISRNRFDINLKQNLIETRLKYNNVLDNELPSNEMVIIKIYLSVYT